MHVAPATADTSAPTSEATPPTLQHGDSVAVALPAGWAAIHHAPHAPARIVGDVERAVRAHGHARRPVRRAPRFLDRAGEAVREHLIRARRAVATEGLERHEVATLREGCAVPGSVKGD